jgi:hypothetical protein
MPQRNLHGGGRAKQFVGIVSVVSGAVFRGWEDAGTRTGIGSARWDKAKRGEVTYTSQGESPLVDLVRHDLMSCGMSCMVQKIAPITVIFPGGAAVGPRIRISSLSYRVKAD